MKNMPIGAIKPKEDEEEVQIIDRPSSSNVPQDDEKDERHANEDTFVSHEQARVQAEDVDAPGSSSQVVDKRNSSLLQAHPQDQIIGSPSQGVITRSHKHASFIEHHSFLSCVEPTCTDEACRYPETGVPLLQYEGAESMRLSLVVWQTTPDPTTRTAPGPPRGQRR